MADYIPNNGWGGLSKYQLEDHRHMPLFLINNAIPPDNVRYGYTEDTEQLVKSQRNSQGVVVAKLVNERLLKFNNLEWPYLSRSDYVWLQQQIAKFYCNLTYWDARKNSYVTKQFYWGDCSAEPFTFDRDTQYGVLRPSSYINVKVNLIDCGKAVTSANLPKFQPPYGAGRDIP